MKTITGFFIAEAPGSTEVYMIPEDTREDYLMWCECELFDEKWQQFHTIFKQHQIVFKQDIPHMEVVVAYVLSCETLLGEKKIAFGGIKALTSYLTIESEDVIFGERDGVLAKDVQWKIDIACMKIEDFEKLQPYA